VRRRWLILAIPGLAVFLAISALLARAFSLPNAEQAAVTDLVTAEAHGDPAAMIAELRGCTSSSACRAAIARDIQRLRRTGVVQIAEFNPSASFSLTSATGVARVAWTAGGSLPVVQCVEVHVTGNVISGQTVQLLALSPQLGGSATCPPRL
jgi:hypothetical protein